VAEALRALDDHRHARVVRPRGGPIALGIAILSGALLFLADLEAFVVSPVFWAKMLLVVLLLGSALASH
jgi:hypothetical protein